MMIPIPHRGVFRHADGLDEARAVAGIDDIRITAKADQLLIPLPEGASYLGFIFARGDEPGDVDRALRAAHARLRFAIDPEIPCSRAATMRYNPSWLMPAVRRRRRLLPSPTRAGGRCSARSSRKTCPGSMRRRGRVSWASGSSRTVSAQAWKLWEERMKMILNEYRLMPWQKEAQDLIAKHMEDFFFGEGAALPPGYVPQQAK